MQEKLKKCLEKHTTNPSIIYLLLFIKFPVYICTHYLSLVHHVVLFKMNKKLAHKHAQDKSRKRKRCIDISLRDKRKERISNNQIRYFRMINLSSNIYIYSYLSYRNQMRCIYIYIYDFPDEKITEIFSHMYLLFNAWD